MVREPDSLRIRGWTMYKRDDKAIAAAKKTIGDNV
jgi:hypothetical protein